MDIERIRSVIALMTLEEKVSLTNIEQDLQSSKIDRLKVDSVKMPYEMNPFGMKNYVRNEAPLSCIASTFDTELVKAFGKLRAIEARQNGEAYAGVLNLGIVRNPMEESAGDSFGEDVFLTKEFAKAWGGGAEEIGLKLAVSNILGAGHSYSERWMDSRALVEIYLGALKDLKNIGAVVLPSGSLNGVMVSQNKGLINYIENNFNSPLIITEYAALVSKVESINAGVNVQLLSTFDDNKQIYTAVKDGVIFEKKLDNQLEKLVSLVVEYNEYKKANLESGKKIGNILKESLETLAYKSLVLLKNEKNILPLIPSEKVVVIGDFASIPDGMQFGDASVIEIFKEKNISAEFVEVPYKACTAKCIKKAVKAAVGADKAVIILQKDITAECESDKLLPYSVELVRAVASVNSNIVAIILSPNFVELDFDGLVSGLMYTSYFGAYLANAILDTLYGVNNPTGKLVCTYAKNQTAYPCKMLDICSNREMFCYESVYNGYRYFSSFDSEVAYPFGHGLSYSEFEYSKEKISAQDNVISIEFVVKNVGVLPGGEVLQVYASNINDKIMGLQRRLVAFKSIYLERWENVAVKFDIDLSNLETYDAKMREWIVYGGRCDFFISTSAADDKLKLNIKIPRSTKIATDFDAKAIPSYFKTGEKFNPLGVEIEKLLFTTIIKRASAVSGYCKKTNDPTVSILEAKRLLKPAFKKFFSKTLYRYNSNKQFVKSRLVKQLKGMSCYSLEKIIE